jgi:hypothetical protein
MEIYLRVYRHEYTDILFLTLSTDRAWNHDVTVGIYNQILVSKFLFPEK